MYAREKPTDGQAYASATGQHYDETTAFPNLASPTARCPRCLESAGIARLSWVSLHANHRARLHVSYATDVPT